MISKDQRVLECLTVPQVHGCCPSTHKQGKHQPPTRDGEGLKGIPRKNTSGIQESREGLEKRRNGRRGNSGEKTYLVNRWRIGSWRVRRLVPVRVVRTWCSCSRRNISTCREGICLLLIDLVRTIQAEHSSWTHCAGSHCAGRA